ncbi:hypothetical protein LTS10_004012 [Elasticomyces elasticus]|nr:hypothetical protein LTS10_004012 [Elasticomyces elasticus]
MTSAQPGRHSVEPRQPPLAPRTDMQDSQGTRAGVRVPQRPSGLPTTRVLSTRPPETARQTSYAQLDPYTTYGTTAYTPRGYPDLTSTSSPSSDPATVPRASTTSARPAYVYGDSPSRTQSTTGRAPALAYTSGDQRISPEGLKYKDYCFQFGTAKFWIRIWYWSWSQKQSTVLDQSTAAARVLGSQRGQLTERHLQDFKTNIQCGTVLAIPLSQNELRQIQDGTHATTRSRKFRQQPETGFVQEFIFVVIIDSNDQFSSALPVTEEAAQQIIERGVPRPIQNPTQIHDVAPTISSDISNAFAACLITKEVCPRPICNIQPTLLATHQRLLAGSRVPQHTNVRTGQAFGNTEDGSRGSPSGSAPQGTAARRSAGAAEDGRPSRTSQSLAQTTGQEQNIRTALRHLIQQGYPQSRAIEMIVQRLIASNASYTRQSATAMVHACLVYGQPRSRQVQAGTASPSDSEAGSESSSDEAEDNDE